MKEKDINKTQKYVALDVGNCCVYVSNDECLRRIGVKHLEDVPKEFLDVCARLECGLISENDWLSEFRKVTGGRFRDDQLIEAWNSIIGEEIQGMAEALKEITSLGVR
ncbi:MAG TPA: hypothetical protein PK821_06515, partial [Victivallales bacterium]|nr:hypothetical protein [Victivallales bacterium]